MIDAAPSGQPVAGVIGSFQCSSRMHAEKFDCFFADECKYEPHESNIDCMCNDGRLEAVIMRPKNLLPQKMVGYSIEGNGKTVEVQLGHISIFLYFSFAKPMQINMIVE